MTKPSPRGSRTILITGAGGFVGSHLAADQARRGNRVVAMDLDLARVEHLRSPGSFELLEGDVTDPAALERAVEGVDTIFHLAAAHLSLKGGERAYRRVNVDAVRALAEQAIRAGVRRFVHCSSVGVFGRIENPPADEDTSCHAESVYERSKLAGEEAVREVLGGSSGVGLVILRPAWVYGPGCPRTEKLFRAIGKKRFLMAGPGDGLRHCVYIRDMVEAFDLASAIDDPAGQVIIVGDAGAVRVRDLLGEIAGLLGVELPRSVPVWALHAVGACAEMAYRLLPGEPPLSSRTVKFFTANTSFDVSRARRVLGYEPRYELSRGLRETHAVLTASPGWRVPLPESPSP